MLTPERIKQLIGQYVSFVGDMSLPTRQLHDLCRAIERECATPPTEVSQCDGCNVGAPLTHRGNHAMPDGGYMGCTQDRYATPPAEAAEPKFAHYDAFTEAHKQVAKDVEAFKTMMGAPAASAVHVTAEDIDKSGGSLAFAYANKIVAGKLAPAASAGQGDARIKRLMEQAGMPNSMSLYQAFKQLENELRQEAARSSSPVEAGAREATGEPIYQTRWVGEKKWLDVTHDQYISALNDISSEDKSFRIVYTEPQAGASSGVGGERK